MTGTRIGQYTILEKIGEGGMGAVWKARDEKLGRTVALKFLCRADSPESRARFNQEARTASSLSHPGIVTIHDIFDHEENSCIVMEFVDGRPLTDLIPAQGMPVRDVVRLGMQIADALAAAHKHNVIHRDIKPGNIMVTPDGRAKLLDFGLAKLAAIAAAPADDHTRTMGEVRTTEGSILGTVNYMSPEQAQGKPVDTRTDIFSIGAVLYEMATGQKAFQGDTTISAITAIMRDEPAAVPGHLGSVISHCMRKEPDRRFQTAIDVRNALEELHDEIRSGISAVQPVPPAKPSRRWLVPVVAAAAVLGAGVATWTVLHSNSAPQPVESIVVHPFASLPGLKTNPNFSPDGNAVVFCWDAGEQGKAPAIYAMLLDGGKPLRLSTGAGRDAAPFYSPDGRRVFFTRVSERGTAAYWVPALGGDEARITNGVAEAISDDGKFLLVTRASVLGNSRTSVGAFVVPLSGGDERLLLPESTDFDRGIYSISPDGQWVYFVQGQVGKPRTAMRMPFAGGQPEPVRIPALESQASRILDVRFFGRNAGMRVTAIEKSTNTDRVWLLKPDGTHPVLLPQGVPAYQISPDGRRGIGTSSYFVAPLYRAAAFPAKGAETAPEKVLDSPRSEQTPRFSPDGARVVVSSTRSGRSALWLWNPAFTDGRPVFDQPSSTSGSPSWSPDGQWIAFDARVKTSVPDIWIVPATGGAARQLTNDPAEDNTPCFDTKGEWIYFTSDREGTQQIFKVAPSGGPATRVTTAGGFSCQVSPDGKYLYYLQNREAGQLWRKELPAGKEEPVLPDFKNRNFRVLTDGIYLLDIGAASALFPNTHSGAAMFYRFSTRKVEKLGFITPKPVTNNGIDLSPDRKWVYFPMADAQATDMQVAENLPFR
jgi:eukaryotic-like serine/threonine-protein kinase